MKRTLKRELKVLEIAKREALKTSDTLSQSLSAPRRFGVVQWATLSASPKGWLGVYDLVSVKINSESVGEGSEEGRRAISVIVLVTLPRPGLRK